MTKYILIVLLLTLPALAGLPPTSTKGNADPNPVTTFEFDFPNLNITHIGARASVPAGSGTISSLTGDVTGSGSGAVATTIATGAVTDTKASLSNKPACTVVATSNQTLSGFPTIDGVTLADGSVALLSAQTAGSENGPWVAHSGAWTRPTWYPSGGTTQAFQFITSLIRLGTTYQGSTWRQTTAAPITIDTTATTWVVTPLALNSNTLSGTVPIGNGGTGQTTANAAFNALSPLTTKGDLIGFSTVNARFPIGSDGMVLSADSTQTTGLKWIAAGGTGTVTSLTAGTGITLTPSPITTTGSIALTVPVTVATGGTGQTTLTAHGVLIGNGASAINATAAGSAGQVLQSGGASADPTYSTATYPSTTTANQILYSSATNTVSGISTAATSALVTNASSVPSLTSGSTANRLLRTDGTTVSFAQAVLTTDVTGILPIANGGSGSSSNTALLLDGTSTMTGQVVAKVGAANSPSYTFSGQTGDGFYSISAQNVGFTTNGTLRYTLNNGGLTSATTSAYAIASGNGANAPPYAFAGNTNSGMYRVTTNTVGISANGLLAFQVNPAASSVNQLAVTPAATTAAPILSAIGTDSNIGITLTPKGTGNTVISANRFLIPGTTVRNSAIVSVDFATTNSGIGINDTGATNGTTFESYLSNNTVIGSITNSANVAVLYNTTSDYRLKKNIVPMKNGLDKIMSLNPVSFNFIKNDHQTDGFLAHEVQAIIPDCVSGEKDAVDQDGNPIYQSIDKGCLTPYIIGAFQEEVKKVDALTAQVAQQQAIIDSLDARLTALENQTP